jgi:hypothetical protein
MLVLLVNVPEMGEPVPLAPNPVMLLVLSLVQLKEVPGTKFGFEIVMLVIAVPEHIN